MMAHHRFQSGPFIGLIFLFGVCLVVSYVDSYKHHIQIDRETWKEFEEFREWKKWKEEYDRNGGSKIHDEDVFEVIEDNSNSEEINWSLDQIPPSDKPALVGRYVVNQSNWTSVATISVNKNIKSFPFANVVAFSDGMIGSGNGIPYMYLTSWDFTGKDINVDPRATLMMTLAQGSYCQENQMDPIDPRCARIIMSGKIKQIPLESPEHDVAKAAVFGRHPGFENLPADHGFYFAKLKISFIAVLDTYGGAKFVPVKDYLYPSALMPKNTNYDKKKWNSSKFDVIQV